MFHASAAEYEVVLTSGATAALKLAAEAFPWQPGGSCFAHTLQNHTSVLGIREVAAAAGAACWGVQLRCGSCSRPGCAGCSGQAAAAPPAGAAGPAEAQQEAQQEGRADGDGAGQPACCLFALPAECNFSGQRYPLGLVQQVQQRGLQLAEQHVPLGQGQEAGEQQAAAARPPPGVLLQASTLERLERHEQQQEGQEGRQQQEGQRRQWYVLLDAAKACSSHPPDLSACPADLVCLSYYKVRGTGAAAGVADCLHIHSRQAELPWRGSGLPITPQL
jgi:molybdenum cofactor sulfurtransferase